MSDKGVAKAIEKLYIKEGYFANYGFDIFIAGLIVFMSISISSLLVIQSTIGQVRADWAVNRCKPVYLPFAGWIMPQPGMTGAEGTSQNIEFCFQSEFSSFVNILLMPIQFIIFMIVTAIDGVLALISSAMDLLSDIEKDLGILWNEIYNLLLQFLVPLLVMFVHLRDAMAKMGGVLATVFWALVNSNNLTTSGIINVASASVGVMEIALLVPIVIGLLVAFVMWWNGIGLTAFVITAPIGIPMTVAAMALLVVIIATILYFYIEAWIQVTQLQTFIEQTFDTKLTKPTEPVNTNITSKHFKI